MEDEFQKRTVLCYSNFMNYIISFSVFNIIILIIENSSIIYSVDLMMDGDKVLNELFTPFYFLSPHLYIEMLNEKFPNQCFQIFDFNSIMLEYEEANKEKEKDDDKENESNKEKENTKDNNLDSTIESTQTLRNIDEKIINTKKKKRLKRLKKEGNKLKHKWKKRRIDNEGDNESPTEGIELQEDKNEEEEEDEQDENPMVAMYKRITEERYYDIKFKGRTLYSLDTSYCVYNKNLIYISYAIVILLFLLLLSLFFLNTRKKKTLVYVILAYTITNLINLIIRPFFIAVVTLLVNRPLLYLYRASYMSSEYQIEEVIYMALSLIMLIFFIALTYLIHDYMNNVFCFESYPYDCFITSEENVFMFIKVCIGFKITYDKIMGFNNFSVINLIVGLFVFYRLAKTLGSAGYVVNHIYLKLTRTFFTFFCCILIVLKLMNQYLAYFQEFSIINFVLEIIFIIFISLTFAFSFTPRIENDFLFIDTKELLEESLRFFYYVNRTFPMTDQKQMRDKKQEKEEFIDKIIIGHKMKCKLDECLICNECIYNPDIKTLTLILYAQFLECEKEFGEDEEGLALLIKLMFILQVDNKKIHRLAFNILKNLKNQNLDGVIITKMIYLYQKCLDRLNEEDPRGLLSVKHDEINEELLQGIKNFEDILGYIRTRTEKVELVTNKTNSLGYLFRKLNKNLFFLKNCKKYGYDMSKFLEMTVLVRLLFPKQLDSELLENIDINFIEFLQAIDKDYLDNITLMLKYDFNNKTWRIKNIPKRFIEHTNYSISELLEQPLDKIFPKVLAKSRIKQLEKEVVLSNPNDEKLEFKTVICDKETNIKSVKFIINVVPNLENNYSIYMRCHFHRRQLIIIDEFGNFMNGSELLYKKVGINADIVASSKGRINIYSMFGLSKKQKIEDIKIVHISTDNITEVTRDLFLIENKNAQKEDDEYDDEEAENVRLKTTQTPMFLNAFLESQQQKPEKKEKPPTVFLQLFNTEVINDIKYYLFTVKLDEKKEKKKDDNEKKELKESTPIDISNLTSKDLISSQIKKTELTNSKITNNKEDEFSENQPLKEEIINEEEEEDDDEKEEIPKTPDNKDENDEKDKNYEDNKNKEYQNYVDYYNNFYDSQHSMSMTMNGANFGSVATSMATSMSSDIFGFLLMKTVSNESTSSKFQKFIYWIGFLGFSLILFGIGCIISLKTNSKTSYQLLELLDDFNFMSLRIFSATDIFFGYSKYFKYTEKALDERENNTFNNYIREILEYKNLSINFDNLILECLIYESNQSLASTYQFNYDSYNYYNEKDYGEKINNNVYYIHLEPSGAYSIKEDKLKNIIDLFTLTLNQISEKKEQKIYLNIKILEYTYVNKYSLDSDMMNLTYKENYTIEEKNQFNDLINLYQHIFNFYNAYISTFESLSSFINLTIRSHFNHLHKVNEILLITVLVVNVIFVLICLFSIVFYRKVLKNEFTNLYGLSEDTITKLQEKFRYIKELIKREHLPSKVYQKIKKLREDIEAALMKAKVNKKKKENKEQNKLMQESAGGITKKAGPKGGPALKRAATQRSESMSVMTTGSQSNGSEYLQFSGAVKGLFRSSTLRAKQQVNKLNKEARKTKASQDLLDRLNFDFEMVKNFILFIVCMSVFYVVLGIVVFIVSENNFTKVIISLDYTDNFKIKFNSLFNFLSSVKIAIITNKQSPYTIYNKTKTPDCKECVINLLSDYTQSSAVLESISSKNEAFNKIYQIESNLQGETLCNDFYLTYNNTWTSYFINKNESYIVELINICKSISILESNPETIFSNLIYKLSKLYTYYSEGNFTLEKRKEILDQDFVYIDLVMTVFVYPYFEYLCEQVILGMNKKIVNAYYIFMIIIFVINIIINILMMLFIWIKIYHQIIRSVENVQLVNDSISVV